MQKTHTIFLASHNIHKFNEARLILAQHNIATAIIFLKPPVVEIQDDNLQNIAETSAIDAAKKSRLPVIVEDAGLFIKALNGFPGPYSSYVYRTIGTRGVLKLMSEESLREAYFLSVVAFSSPEQSKPKCFQGKIEGKITHKEKGREGFGFDPIFEPFGANGKTFAEMTTKQKNKYSHRAQAFRKFADWYAQRKWL